MSRPPRLPVAPLSASLLAYYAIDENNAVERNSAWNNLPLGERFITLNDDEVDVVVTDYVIQEGFKTERELSFVVNTFDQPTCESLCDSYKLMLHSKDQPLKELRKTITAHLWKIYKKEGRRRSKREKGEDSQQEDEEQEKSKDNAENDSNQQQQKIDNLGENDNGASSSSSSVPLNDVNVAAFSSRVAPIPHVIRHIDASNSSVPAAAASSSNSAPIVIDAPPSNSSARVELHREIRRSSRSPRRVNYQEPKESDFSRRSMLAQNAHIHSLHRQQNDAANEKYNNLSRAEMIALLESLNNLPAVSAAPPTRNRNSSRQLQAASSNPSQTRISTSARASRVASSPSAHLLAQLGQSEEEDNNDDDYDKDHDKDEYAKNDASHSENDSADEYELQRILAQERLNAKNKINNADRKKKQAGLAAQIERLLLLEQRLKQTSSESSRRPHSSSNSNSRSSSSSSKSFSLGPNGLPMMAVEVMSNIRNVGHATMEEYIQKKVFKSASSQRQLTAIARALDYIAAGNTDFACEVLVRRLVGVTSADDTGNWSLCDSIEGVTKPAYSLLPEHAYKHLTDQINRAQTVEKLTATMSTDRRNTNYNYSNSRSSSSRQSNNKFNSSSSFSSGANGDSRHEHSDNNTRSSNSHKSHSAKSSASHPSGSTKK